ncbi:MAG: hypothetical protein K2X47_17570 [Bdellovibrionales bacterium]|nr:hypothetical protein [Bdellovibrionales bacterium]
MSIKRAQQVMQIFIVTVILVVGGVTALTVTDSTQTEVSLPSREPASLSISVEPKTLRKEIEVVQLHCDHRSYNVPLVSQIRLSGTMCLGQHPRGTLKRSRIKNTSTNSEAMVFLLEKANHFTTDLIPVQSGKNSIEIQTDYDDGRTESKIIDVLIQ